ncbi:hypothetical protein HZB94_01585 [Candidatus Falkowbacteria bacterium]|nr:hypothetical protein [Candidatus Falkowbacteria bacterium]
MRLSSLQKYILLQCYHRIGARMGRDGLVKFYEDKRIPRKALRQKIITRSIESLIDKELLVGYGLRTPHKWFIKEIRLTGKGEKMGRKLLGEQMRLPFRK